MQGLCLKEQFTRQTYFSQEDTLRSLFSSQAISLQQALQAPTTKPFADLCQLKLFITLFRIEEKLWTKI
jgi:hypothetical protein